MWHAWIDGARIPRRNLKIPIGTTKKQKAAGRALAEQAYHKLMLDQAADRLGLEREKPARSFKEQREWYAEHVTPMKRSKASETSQLLQLSYFFDKYQLKDISQAVVREWRKGKKIEGLKDSTIGRQEALLRHLLGTAIPEYIADNPLVGLRGLKPEPTHVRILSRDEETRLLAALETPVDKALIICAVDTLLRLGNVSRLERKQDHGTYLFARTKTGSVRVPISTRLRAALDALPDAGRYFWPQYVSDKLSDKTRRMFMAACEKANIPRGRSSGGISFHCLRHTGATRMLAAGVDIKTVMEIGDWKTMAVVARYLHSSDKAKLDAVEAIAG
jgi:integrase